MIIRLCPTAQANRPLRAKKKKAAEGGLSITPAVSKVNAAKFTKLRRTAAPAMNHGPSELQRSLRSRLCSASAFNRCLPDRSLFSCVRGVPQAACRQCLAANLVPTFGSLRADRLLELTPGEKPGIGWGFASNGPNSLSAFVQFCARGLPDPRMLHDRSEILGRLAANCIRTRPPVRAGRGQFGASVMNPDVRKRAAYGYLGRCDRARSEKSHAPTSVGPADAGSEEGVWPHQLRYWRRLASQHVLDLL
jgi:hypothetical protein